MCNWKWVVKVTYRTNRMLYRPGPPRKPRTLNIARFPKVLVASSVLFVWDINVLRATSAPMKIIFEKRINFQFVALFNYKNKYDRYEDKTLIKWYNKNKKYYKY